MEEYTNYTLSVTDDTLTIDLTERLVTNRQYLVVLSPGMSGLLDTTTIGIMDTEYQFLFTTVYCPTFSTVGRVKLVAGPPAEDIAEDTIWRMIHKNSLDIIDNYNMTNGTKYAYDNWGCDWQEAPLDFKRYVECKTAYDLLSFIKYLNTNGGYGSQLKTLGDMTIQYHGGSSANLPDSDKLKDLYNCWNEIIRNLHNIDTAVRGLFSTSKMFPHPVLDIYHNRVLRPETSDTRYGRTPGSTGWRGF